jgi:hypothetical protein
VEHRTDGRSVGGAPSDRSGWDWKALVSAARQIGLSQDAFWGMTPREFARELDAARALAHREHERSTFLAWQTAAFVGSAFAGKLQDWAQVAARIAPTPLARNRHVVAIFSDATGVPVRPISDAALKALERLKEQRDSQHG